MKKAILKTQKIITEKEVFDLLKDRENFKEILQMAFYGLFDLPSYMIKQFIDLGDGFFDLKMHNSGTTHRLIKFKRDIIKSDYYDIKLNYTKSGSIFFANDPDHTMEDSAVPCKTIVLRSTDERFKIEIYFVIYKSSGIKYFGDEKTDAYLGTINQFLNQNACNLDIFCYYKFDYDKSENALQPRLIDNMLWGSFKLFLDDIDDQISEFIKKSHPHLFQTQDKNDLDDDLSF